MGESRVTYLIVGSFVVAMIAATVLAVARLSGWTAENDAYFTAFRNVSGIKAGSTVLYEGYPIGQVSGISPLDPGIVNATRLNPLRTWFRVDFDVQRGWRIPSTSTASIVASGFLAAPSVTIVEEPDGDRPPGDAIAVGGFVPGEEATSIFRQAETLAETVQSVAMIARETLEGRVNPTIDDARALIGQIAAGLDPVIRETETLLTSLQGATDDFRELVGPDNRDKVAALLTTLDAAATDVRRLTKSLARTAGEIETLVSDNRTDIDQSIESLRYLLDTLARDVNAINRDLEATARNMNEFSRRIRQNPGLLLGGAEPRDGGPQGAGP